MRGSYSFDTTGNSTGVEPIVRLWLLRLLVPLGAGINFFSDPLEYKYGSGKKIYPALAEIFNIKDEWSKKSNSRIDRKKALKCLHKLYVTEEIILRNAKAPKLLAGNVKRLSKLAGLPPTDCRILEFVVLLHTEEVLEVICNLLGDLSKAELFRVLSRLLILPEAEIRKSLSKRGGLFRSGLVTLEKYSRRDELKDKLELLSASFADAMVSSDATPEVLLRDLVLPGTPPHLKIDDFPHKSKEIDMLLPYLKKSIITGRRGVNILMYGDPGTGKSQLAKILALETGCELFEVASEDEDGGPLADKGRLRSFHAAQALLSGRKIIILFDEIEDVFDAGDGFFAKILGLDETARNPVCSAADIVAALEEECCLKENFKRPIGFC